jgi:hypothetical protein
VKGPKPISAHETCMVREQARWLRAVLPFPVYTRRERKRGFADLARHEAAHVVVGTALGAHVYGVAAGRTATGEHDGISLFIPMGNPTKNAMISVAGAAADGFDGLGVLDASTFIDASHDARVPPAQFYRGARRSAGMLLRKHSAAVDVLAEEILEHGVAFWEDIRRVLRGAGLSARAPTKQQADRYEGFERGMRSAMVEGLKRLHVPQERAQRFLADEAAAKAKAKADAEASVAEGASVAAIARLLPWVDIGDGLMACRHATAAEGAILRAGEMISLDLSTIDRLREVATSPLPIGHSGPIDADAAIASEGGGPS